MQDTITINPNDTVALAEVLREDLPHQRWFRSKARTLRAGRIRDSIAIPGTDSRIILLDVEFQEGDVDTYALTVTFAHGETPRGAKTIAGTLYDALWNGPFTDALLNAISRERSFSGERGNLTTCHTSAFERIAGTRHTRLTARVSKAEQSNSSVFYGDRFVLKLYRKLEPGINPDFEIGRFLTEQGFRHTPAVAGHIEYRGGTAAPTSLGILQQYIPNQGDAWEYTLQSASRFFDRALETGLEAPPLPGTEHPLELMGMRPPAETEDLIGNYLESACLLGLRTAQLHIALSSGEGGPDFEPEPFTDDFRNKLHGRLIAQADAAIRVVREKRDTLSRPIAQDAQRLLDLEPRILEVFRRLCENRIHAVRIRHHGDFHLGQVLYTGDDFVIIDFEGEPARSLEERRMKRAALRDVAGMIRSFQYAAYSALRKRQHVLSGGETWAAFWTAWVSRAFVAAYFGRANGHPFLPDNEHERKLLFDVFLLEKALYEVAYELNNRPDWVGIPLRGVAAVMA
ncbi:MAG TPA: putative maltokinase [Bryobacteraceae bacterium]|nr:putative maltokinase [Bryobacteraceae bacterium]